jgi:transposase/quinol monooxygenase YgiN
MIIRVFQARLKPGKREAFERLCREINVPLMTAQPGCLTVRIGEPAKAHPDIFVIVSLWRDLPSLQAFTGERWQEATILPGEADLLEEAAVQHYDESYAGLVSMWHAVAEVVREREVTVLRAPLSAAQWEQVRGLLPAEKRTGRPRADDRQTLEGILYVLRTGCRWRDLPERYGSPVTCWRRFRQWEADGTWERVWRALFATLDVQGKQAWALAFFDAHHIPAKRERRAVHARPRDF